MKLALILVLTCVVASQAQLFGLGQVFRNFLHGGGYGNQEYANGLGGQSNMGYQNSGMGGYHNIGAHNRRISNIQQSEDSGYHNMGGGQGYNNLGYGANGYNGYNRGLGNYGNSYGQGIEGENMM
ncbi:unnamed protein product [Colias eurytheme]|nr:unnamed protein product [Colias eurytheme]